MTFACHVPDICKKASRNINALARIAPHINIGERQILMNSLFKSDFTSLTETLFTWNTLICEFTNVFFS